MPPPQALPPVGRGIPPPHIPPLGAFGASILAPSALDLGAFGASCPPPQNEMSGSATGSAGSLCTALATVCRKEQCVFQLRFNFLIPDYSNISFFLSLC